MDVQPITPSIGARVIVQAGDFVIFNNPGLLHRSYPYSDAQRVLHRTTLKGLETISKGGTCHALSTAG